MSFEKFEVEGHPVRWFLELPSTNTYLKEHPELLDEAGQVVVTSHQTAGRGRRGTFVLVASGQEPHLFAGVASGMSASAIDALRTLVGNRRGPQSGSAWCYSSVEVAQ